MDDIALRKKFAIDANGKTWELLGKATRSEEEDLALVGAAYASLYLWDAIGTDLHRARGHWLLSRAHVVTGDARRAVNHAELCARLTRESGSSAKDFDAAYAHEAVARAYAAAGDFERARLARAEAARVGESISDPEDKAIFVGDFLAEPWFGLSSVA